MTYPKILLYFCGPFYLIIFSALFFEGKSILGIFSPSFFYTLLIFWLSWWFSDALALRKGIWKYSPDKIWGIWIGGIPLEDHLVAFFMVGWMYYSLLLFSR